MQNEDSKFKIEVRFSKNRHYPEYGENAYNVESYSIYIPYGRRFNFRNSNSAILFVKGRIDDNVLNHFDSISIIKWRGYSGIIEYLKEGKEKSDTNPIDKEFAESVLCI